MGIVLTVPEEFVSDWQHGDTTPLSRHALELLAQDGYKAAYLSEFQKQQMLGLADRFEVHGFLKDPGVYQDYFAEELNRKKATLPPFLAPK